MTKIAVVEQGVCVPGEEVVFWEPLTDQGLVAREHDVFEEFEAPVPQTTQEAIEDESTHEHNEDTQVYSVTFVGRALLWCKHEAEKADELPTGGWKKYLESLAPLDWSVRFEGALETITPCPRNLIWDDLDRINGFELRIDWARDYGYTQMPRERAQSFLIPRRVISVKEPEHALAEDAFDAAAYAIRDMLRRMAEGAFLGIRPRHRVTCLPSRSRELDAFYSQVTPMQIENLQIRGFESDCTIADEA